MLRINRQTDYAVRVILALSKKEEGKRVSTSEVGREMLIPPALLQRIVAELASGGFILTQAGRDGGITLAHSPKQITLLQIVEHFEGELYLSDCILKPGGHIPTLSVCCHRIFTWARAVARTVWPPSRGISRAAFHDSFTTEQSLAPTPEHADSNGFIAVG